VSRPPDRRECFDRAAIANSQLRDTRSIMAGRMRDRERLVRAQERLRELVTEYERDPASLRTKAAIARLKDWLDQ